jgi:hypothetical protein
MTNDYMDRLAKVLPKTLLLELYHMTAVRALKAHEIIRDGTDLKGKNARAAEGQVRFRSMEEGFRQVCEQHGGVVREGGVIEGTDLHFFQPFAHFGGGASGVVLGLASMPKRGELPVKNQSRLAGISLNYRLTPRLPLDEHEPKLGDIFVSFLVARDTARAGHIDEVAIGVIGSDYESFVFYEKIETFMARYAPPDQPAQEGDAAPALKLALKKQRTTYKPPETKDDEKDAKKE